MCNKFHLEYVENPEAGARIVFDPQDPEQLYIAVFVCSKLSKERYTKERAIKELNENYFISVFDSRDFDELEKEVAPLIAEAQRDYKEEQGKIYFDFYPAENNGYLCLFYDPENERHSFIAHYIAKLLNCSEYGDIEQGVKRICEANKKECAELLRVFNFDILIDEAGKEYDKVKKAYREIRDRHQPSIELFKIMEKERREKK